MLFNQNIQPLELSYRFRFSQSFNFQLFKCKINKYIVTCLASWPQCRFIILFFRGSSSTHEKDFNENLMCFKNCISQYTLLFWKNEREIRLWFGIKFQWWKHCVKVSPWKLKYRGFFLTCKTLKPSEILFHYLQHYTLCDQKKTSPT